MPYAAANGVLQAQRDRLDYIFSYLCGCDEDIKQSADKYHGKCLLPCEPETEAYGVNEKRVKTHARSLSVRYICHKTHYEGAYDRCDYGSQEDGSPLHNPIETESQD